MPAVGHCVEVNASDRACYDWWWPLTRLPDVMSDVEMVEPVSAARATTRRTVTGPTVVLALTSEGGRSCLVR